MNFSEFTRMNQIVKSVRFELVPCGRTREYLDIHNVLSSDIERTHNVEVANRISDSFIREFIETLSGDYEWDKLYAVYNTPEYRMEADKMKEIIAADVYEKFIMYINEYAKCHGIDEKVTFPGPVYLEDILPVYAGLSNEYNTPEYAQVLLSLKNTFSTLFKRTFKRYDTILFGTKNGSIANRMIENFGIAVENKTIYDKYAGMLVECPIEMLCDINSINNCMSQNGIRRYNEIIGGIYNKEGKAVKEGINQLINKYNQTNPDLRIPLFKQLHKQILTESQPAFNVEVIASRAEFDGVFQILNEKGRECEGKLQAVMWNLKNKYNRRDVYLSVEARRKMSEKLCGSWSYIDGILEQAECRRIKEEYFGTKGKRKERLTQKEEKQVYSRISMHISSVYELDEILCDLGEETVVDYISDLFDECNAAMRKAYSAVMQCGFWKNDKKPQWEDNETIQIYLNSVIEMAGISKLFVVSASRVQADIDLAEKIEELLLIREDIARMYDLLRNYLTKKTEDEAKKKSAVIMFGRAAHINQTWITTKEGRFGNADAAILEFAGKYYYMVSGAAKQKLNIPMLTTEEITAGRDYYNCLYTKKNGRVAMMLPKLTFASKQAKRQYAVAEYDEEFEIQVGNDTMRVSRKMYEDYAAKTFREDENAKIALINYAKEFLEKDNSFKYYDFAHLKDAEEYTSYGEFCNDVDAITFRTEQKYIEKSTVDDAVENGNVYLFLITNQDMYKEPGRCRDKTSLRFRAIIDSMFNGDNAIIINNSPLIQYRPAVIVAKETHPVGSMLVNKLTADGEKIPVGVYNELYEYYNNRINTLSAEAKTYEDKVVVKRADFAHIMGRRYTREMFTITLTYTINKSVTSGITGYNLNRYVNERMKSHGYNMLTVIRGIDNLLYYYLSDADGNKILSGGLNSVGTVDYKKRLDVLGKERRKRQIKWNYGMDDKVAAVKDAYLNEACREIIKIAINYNAVIVIDLISSMAKEKASAFDNNVYQKFEKKLVMALSDCCDITIAQNEAGGIINPLQLSSVEPMKGYQNGIVFFVSNAMTKSVCPDTGFVNVFSSYNICTLAAKRACLEHMKIYYDKEIGEFRYDFSFADIGSTFQSSDMPESIDRIWSVRTHMTRCSYDGGTHSYREINGTALLLEYVARNNISLDETINVLELDNEGIRVFYDVFINYINGFVRAKNTRYYVSPVTGWCSLGSVEYDEMTAHRIAVKASLMIRRILSEESGKDIAISRGQWYDILKC